MPESVRERVQRHREEARSKGLVRVEVELPAHLLALRRSDENLKALLIRALTALLPPATRPPRPSLPETLPETSSTPRTAMKLPETLPETSSRPRQARAWEAEFIRHWQAGASEQQLATALGILPGTVKSRAHTLQREGKIQPRARGGKRQRR